MPPSKAGKPRLLFLMNEALFFTTHRLPIALAAREAGYDVHVAAPFDEGPVDVIRQNGFAWHDLPLRRGGRNILAELWLLLACFRLIARLRPQLVHHVAMKPVIYGGLASRLLRVPAVVHAITGLGFLFIRRNLSARLIRSMIMPLYRFSLGHPNSRVIFQNRDDLDLFRRHRLVDESRAVMIRGCGVDMTEFHPAARPEGPPIVMFPARIIGDKGVNEFVEAARLLCGEGVQARFVLVGRRDPDNPTDVAEAVIRSWEAEGIVEWWGFRADMAAVLPQAAIVCMPSYREGMPRVLIEAAACGAPVVTTDVPGCREAIEDGATGLLVPAQDGVRTANAIRRLLDDDGMRERFSRAARARAEAEFSVEEFVDASMAAYRAITG